MPRKQAIDLFSAAFKSLDIGPAGRKMEHIGHPTHYADVVSMWVRSKRYLTPNGYPKTLPLKGRNGFASIVRQVSPGADPRSVLAVLMRFKNVRQSKDGTYQLIRPFFYTSGPTSMAFEPVAYFLSDASATLGRILKKSPKSHGPDLFWQKTESTRISDATARKFAAFAKERSLVFLDEMDDWLEAHSASESSRCKSRRRVGLGIFSIYSDRESSPRGSSMLNAMHPKNCVE